MGQWVKGLCTKLGHHCTGIHVYMYHVYIPIMSIGARPSAGIVITSGGTIPKNHESIIEPLMELRIDHRDIEVQ